MISILWMFEFLMLMLMNRFGCRILFLLGKVVWMWMLCVDVLILELMVLMVFF